MPALIAVNEPPVGVQEVIDDDDFLTDESSSKTESSHEDEELRWQKPKEWDAQVRNKPLLKKLGDLVWKAPADRGSVESDNVGLNSETEFEMKAGDKFLDIFFEATVVLWFNRVDISQHLHYCHLDYTVIQLTRRCREKNSDGKLSRSLYEASEQDRMQAARARGDGDQVPQVVAPPESQNPIQIREQGRGGTHHHDIQPVGVCELGHRPEESRGCGC